MRPAGDLRPCRGCGRMVRWVTTQAGKAMPLDPAPRADGNIVFESEEEGRVRYVTPGQPDLFGQEAGPRYVSHFATCPKAKGFRQTTRRG